MGMDVHGKTNEAYFRANVWSWHPIAEYVQEKYPALARKVTYWHTNDGDGLDERDAHQLGRYIAEDIKEGTALLWLQERRQRLAMLPRVQCNICLGKGIRTQEDNIRLGVGDQGYFLNWEPKECNGCQGLGDVADWATHYDFDLDHLQEFADFLQECDGFEIW